MILLAKRENRKTISPDLPRKYYGMISERKWSKGKPVAQLKGDFSCWIRETIAGLRVLEGRDNLTQGSSAGTCRSKIYFTAKV